MSDDTMITSPRGQVMLSYLPPLYQSSRVMQLGIFQPEGTQFDALWGTLDDILNQFFAETATWAIDKWESELGIVSDPSKPLFQRRSQVIAQLRGYGTATIGVITQIVKGYDPTAYVIEDFGSYRVHLFFPNGLDLSLDDMRKMVRKLLPAHLDFVEAFGTTVNTEVSAGYSSSIRVDRTLYANNSWPILNATWPLDGTQPMDGAVTPLPSASSQQIIVVSETAPLAQYTDTVGIVLDGGRTLDGSWSLSGATAETVTMAAQVGVGVSCTATDAPSASSTQAVVTTRYASGHNLPVLNGTWVLDGSQTLDGRVYGYASVTVNGQAA